MSCAASSPRKTRYSPRVLYCVNRPHIVFLRSESAFSLVWMSRDLSASQAYPPRCSGFAMRKILCGLRQTPCLYSGPTAANARGASPPSSPGRSLFMMPFRRSSRRSLAHVSLENRPDRLCFLLRCGLRWRPLHSPLFVGLSCRHGVSRNSDDIDHGGSIYEHYDHHTCCLRWHVP